MVQTEAGRRKAGALKARFAEVSARSGEGVVELFRLIPLSYLAKQLNDRTERSGGVDDENAHELPCC
jgi:hypothetical protein